MSEAATPVTVRILDKEYQVACPPGEHAQLIDAAEYLTGQMREIRDNGRVVGLDRIAVMVALNLANELLQERGRAEEQTADRRTNELRHSRQLSEQRVDAVEELDVQEAHRRAGDRQGHVSQQVLGLEVQGAEDLAVDRQHRRGLGQRQPQPDGGGQPHRAQHIEILRPVAQHVQFLAGQADIADHEMVANDGRDIAQDVGADHGQYPFQNLASVKMATGLLHMKVYLRILSSSSTSFSRWKW